MAAHLEMESTLARLGGDRELLSELYAAFHQDSEQKLSGLVAAVPKGDLDTIMKLSHALKGAAAAIGATPCRNLAEQLEIAARDGNRKATLSIFPSLRQELEDLRALIAGQL